MKKKKKKCPPIKMFAEVVLWWEKKHHLLQIFRFEYSNSSVMLNMYIGHTHFKTVVCATKLRAPQVGTSEYLHINISISKASTLN